MAAKRRHWKEKGGRYWARIAIPANLRSHFGNKTELIEPLGGDLRLAERKHAAAVARLQGRLDDARTALSGEPFQSGQRQKPLTLADVDLQSAAWSHYTATLAANDLKRASLPTSVEIPLLCAFTGARVTEITQLRKEDVRQEDGRWIIRITPDAGSVKSGHYRDVPLHRQVVNLGFIDFVNDANFGPMFHRAKTPEKYLANARTTGGRLSEWLHDLKLVPEGVAPLYGWRHRFKTQGRDLGMSDRVLDAIQGHPGKRASDNYGDVTIKAKLKMIDALPDYDLAQES